MQEALYTTDDQEAWEAAMPAQASVFGSIGYARIVQRHTGYPAHLMVVSSDEGRIVYPFLLRPVSSLPFAGAYRSWWDTFTPEYTGPIGFGAVKTALRDTFRTCWDRLCTEEGIIAEFAHLHPSDRHTGLLRAEDVHFNREIVVVDLTCSEEELWSRSFTGQCARNIRRAEREQVRVFEGRTKADISEFYRIYTMTMERHNADARYFFPFEYFWSFREEMPDNSLFLLAERHDRIIAAKLYLFDDKEMYDFLGGMDIDYRQCRAAHAIIYAAIRWGQYGGKRRLILGGGYRPNDGIYQFKASFSPLRLPFSTYRRIHHPALYADLCQAWSEHYGCSSRQETEYFPVYRAVPLHDEGRTREVGG